MDASDKMDLQAGQIKTLQTCLGGVTQALSDVADGDYPGAIAALDAVEDSCRRANSLF